MYNFVILKSENNFRNKRLVQLDAIAKLKLTSLYIFYIISTDIF